MLVVFLIKGRGCKPPVRDTIDTRIVKEVREGFATYDGKNYKQIKRVADTSIVCGIIDSQNDVGAWPDLHSIPAPKDSDHDGMPDSWEDKNGLDKKNPNDRNVIAPDGYTMLENYMNGIK